MSGNQGGRRGGNAATGRMSAEASRYILDSTPSLGAACEGDVVDPRRISFTVSGKRETPRGRVRWALSFGTGEEMEVPTSALISEKRFHNHLRLKLGWVVASVGRDAFLNLVNSALLYMRGRP